MQNKFYAYTTAILFAATLQTTAQLSFTNTNARLTNAAFHSGCAVSIADWNGDGLDDIIRLADGHDAYVEVQQVNQSYQSIHLGDFGSGNSAWAMCVADVDHNGYKDILADASGGVIKILMTNNTGTGGTFVTLPNSGFFLQNATFADINNDGWIDAFLCDDNAESHVYLNNGTGTLAPSNIINFDVTSTDDSGNYGSVWTDFDNDGDFDLYIAKCRQGVNSPSDGRRIDVLFENNGNGTFTENAAAHGLANGWQTWTASFGDIDNDGDLDLMATNHDHESQIFTNDGNENYTDITSTTGFDITDITPIESVMEDFDNDGFIDILTSGSDSRYYKNNGNGTFTKVDNLFNNGNYMLTFAIGDINHDGFTDVYAGYGSIYTNPSSVFDDVIWMNNTNSNHFFTLNLKGTVSNHDAIGVRASIYGAWGVQIRESRAGESYGTTNTAMCHFGLGQATVIDSVVISWPSGITQTIYNPAIDQFLTVIENDCVSPTATITSSGNNILCPGQSLTLTAPAGYNYLWSDGSTTQSISVSQTGDYNVQVTAAGNNCVAQSPVYKVIQSPNQTPVIAATGITEVCDGTPVTLNGPSDPGIFAYIWSNGDTTQNATITSSGSYTLTIQGYCQQFTSNSINVTVHTPANPVANDVYLTSPGTANLTSTGNNIVWYSDAGGTTPVATGNAFTTPFLSDTTVYYVQATDVYGGALFSGGSTYHTGTNQYSGGTTNAKTYFDVINSCTLQSVKVYTDTPGDRNIQLYDNTGAVINNQVITINPDSQVITLNWPLSPGTGYSIGTDETYNLNIPTWNQVSPRFKRTNGGGIVYPYTIPNLVSITGNDLLNNFYYYFYDWKVQEAELNCTSALVPVTVFVGPTGLAELSKQGISIYPNPANNILHIDVKTAAEINFTITDFTGRVVKSQSANAASNKIDITKLSQGVYHLNISVNDQLYVYRFVKQ